MESALYSARIGDSYSIGERMQYEALLRRIMEFTIRAAIARSIDESEWEHEELRHKGLGALAILRGGKAIWIDGELYARELAEAKRERDPRFEQSNELDPVLFERLDCDLRERWRRAGYDVPCLMHDMKKLFTELERDASDRAAGAREDLLAELLKV